MAMDAKDLKEQFDEVFTRLRATEMQSSNLCTRLDMVVDQIKTSNTVTDKFIDLLEKRRVTDEAREAKFWKTLAVLIGAIIAIALGKDPAKAIVDHIFSPSATQQTQFALPWNDDEKYT